MKDVTDRLAHAWAAISALHQVPDLYGNPGLGVTALTGAPAPKRWKAVVSATAPLIPGDELRFVVTADQRAFVDVDMPDDALAPLTAELATQIEAPYCAVAVRSEGDVWAAAADPAEAVELDVDDADSVEVSRVGGEVAVVVDGDESWERRQEFEWLLDGEENDVSVIARRFAGRVWIVERFPL